MSETFQSISKGGFEQQRSRLQRRRAPPAAEAARSCWGRGQRYASKAQRMLGAATRPPAAETGRGGWGSAPIFQDPAKGSQKNRQAQLVRPAASRPGGKKAPAGPFSMRGLRNPPAPTKNSSVVMTLEFLSYVDLSGCVLFRGAPCFFFFFYYASSFSARSIRYPTPTWVWIKCGASGFRSNFLRRDAM